MLVMFVYFPNTFLQRINTALGGLPGVQTFPIIEQTDVDVDITNTQKYLGRHFVEFL